MQPILLSSLNPQLLHGSSANKLMTETQLARVLGVKLQLQLMLSVLRLRLLSIVLAVGP